MWMLALLFGALALGLSPMGERRVRLAATFLVLLVVGYESVKFSLL